MKEPHGLQPVVSNAYESGSGVLSLSLGPPGSCGHRRVMGKDATAGRRLYHGGIELPVHAKVQEGRVPGRRGKGTLQGELPKDVRGTPCGPASSAPTTCTCQQVQGLRRAVHGAEGASARRVRQGPWDRVRQKPWGDSFWSDGYFYRLRHHGGSAILHRTQPEETLDEPGLRACGSGEGKAAGEADRLRLVRPHGLQAVCSSGPLREAWVPRRDRLGSACSQTGSHQS